MLRELRKTRFEDKTWNNLYELWSDITSIMLQNFFQELVTGQKTEESKESNLNYFKEID